MLRVTVMMFRDMVESVMLLKEEACRATQVRAGEQGLHGVPPPRPTPAPPPPTRSACRRRCFRRLRLCFRMSREDVLCSVELLRLGEGRGGRVGGLAQDCKAGAGWKTGRPRRLPGHPQPGRPRTSWGRVCPGLGSAPVWTRPRPRDPYRLRTSVQHHSGKTNTQTLGKPVRAHTPVRA